MSNHRQLKILRLNGECNEDVLYAAATFKIRQRLEEKWSIKVTKRHKDRFREKQNN